MKRENEWSKFKQIYISEINIYFHINYDNEGDIRPMNNILKIIIIIKSH